MRQVTIKGILGLQASALRESLELDIFCLVCFQIRRSGKEKKSSLQDTSRITEDLR